MAVVFVGLVGGGLLAAAAAERRTSTAYDRLRRLSAAPDLVIGGAECSDSASQAACAASSERALRELPEASGVRGAAIFELFSGVFATARGAELQAECQTGSGEVTVAAPTGTSSGEPVQTPVVIEGRAADPLRPDEVVIGVATAEDGVGVGDTIVAELGEFCPEPDSPPRTRIDLRVVGVAADVVGLRPGFGEYVRAIYATPAFETWARQTGLPGVLAAFVRLEPGATADTVIGDGKPLSVVFAGDSLREAIERSVNRDALALLLIVGLGAALVLLVVGPAMVRAERAVLDDSSILRTIGFTRGDLLRLGLLHGLAVGVPAALVALLVAFLVSPVAPVGDAASFEPSPGLSADWTVLAPGAIVVVATTILFTTFAAGVRALTRSRSARRSVGSWLAESLSVSPVGQLRVRFASDTVTGRAVSGMGGLITQIVAVAAVAGALTFTAGSTRLHSEPRLVGWNWDAFVLAGERTSDLAVALRSAPGVERLSLGTYFTPGPEGFTLGAGRVASWVLSLEAGPSSVPFTVIEGRSPTGDHEVLVHPDVLDALGAHIGDTTSVDLSESLGGAAMDVTIVGTGVLPLDGGQFRSASGMTFAGLSALLQAGGAATVIPEMVVLDLAASVDPSEFRNRLLDLGFANDDILLSDDARVGTEVVSGLNLDDPVVVPRALAILAAVLGASVLGLLVVARRREWDREIAIHRAVGFTASQTQRAVVTGAALLALFVVVIGVPIGVAVGRIAWLTYAASLGVKPEAAVPWPWLGLVVAGALCVAVVAAAAAEWAARRRGPLRSLRTG